jgi:hypothetical protein
MPTSPTYWDTEEWVESGWEYALAQNTAISSLGITSFFRNPTINDELSFPHVQVECIAVYPASRKAEERYDICEVEITVRASKGIDTVDTDNASSVQRQLLGKICGAIRAVLYAPATDISGWLETGGGARLGGSEPNIINVGNPRYQADRISSVDRSDQDYHIRTFTVTCALEPHPDYA